MLPVIYLVRHGQASCGADDNDRLSMLGEQQAGHLGDVFYRMGLAADAVVSGSLERQQSTARGMVAAPGWGHETKVDPRENGLWSHGSLSSRTASTHTSRPVS